MGTQLILTTVALSKRFIEDNKTRIYICIIGLILLLVGYRLCSISNIISNLVGYFLIATGSQSLLWAVGIRLEFLGTKAEIEENENFNERTKTKTIDQLIDSFHKNVDSLENIFVSVYINTNAQPSNSWSLDKQTEILHLDYPDMVIYLSREFKQFISHLNRMDQRESETLNTVLPATMRALETFNLIKNLVLFENYSISVVQKRRIYDSATTLMTFLAIW